MAAPKGNNYGLKIKEPDLRQKAYDQYCAWLARGKSPKSFTFIEGDLMCTYKTIESYIKENPHEFLPLKKETAFAQGYAHWESVVDGSADGSNKDACTPSLNMLMRNKYGWDKEEKEMNQTPTETVQFSIADAKDLNGQHSTESETSRQPPRGNSKD